MSKYFILTQRVTTFEYGGGLLVKYQICLITNNNIWLVHKQTKCDNRSVLLYLLWTCDGMQHGGPLSPHYYKQLHLLLVKKKTLRSSGQGWIWILGFRGLEKLSLFHHSWAVLSGISSVSSSQGSSRTLHLHQQLPQREIFTAPPQKMNNLTLYDRDLCFVQC